MSSIIENYNYDIFISYRQKDNKGDRWVSEFVTALKDELDATFKEEISIYFDENPHDGLLETHDVNASLKEKLNCLIFVPIISRTYCDRKAFAWVNEFLEFIRLSAEDQFGLKVTLPNGNVGTRVLPIRIHELSPEDTSLCESVLGGVLRGIDFIYKAPGVNRPLRLNEDHPQDNLNRTYYRDQINKVANAISDIISSLKYGKYESHEKAASTSGGSAILLNKSSDRIRRLFKGSGAGLKRKIFVPVTLLIAMLAVYLVYKSTYLDKIENKIAFLRLQNTSNDSTLFIAASEFIDAVNQKITLVKSISKIPGFLLDRYDETENSLMMIRKDLKAGYVLYGKIREENNDIRIWVELSTTKDYKVLWNKTYTWRNDLVSKTTSEIVRMIADRMGIKLTPEEEKQIDTEVSVNPDLNMIYITADSKLKDAWDYYNYGDKLLDSTSFKSAIESYDKILEEDSLSALAYARRAIAQSWGYYAYRQDSSNIQKCREDIEKALSLDRDLSEIDIAQGFYYYYCLEQNEKALEYFARASVKEPESYKPLFYMALASRRMGKWDECRKLIQKVIKFNPQEALFLTNIGMTYSFFHNYDSAILFFNKSISMIPEWTAAYKNKFEVLILKNGVTAEARKLIEDVFERTGDNMIEYRILLKMYENKYSDALILAESSDLDDYDLPGEKYIYMARLNKLMNNTQSALRYYESARIILSQYIKKEPDAHTLHGMMGLVYAGLGNKSKAIDEVETAIQIAHLKNRVDETDMQISLAQVYTMLGDYDNALPRILFLLNNPSFLSKELLLTDPVWMPILDHPDYKKKIR